VVALVVVFVVDQVTVPVDPLNFAIW